MGTIPQMKEEERKDKITNERLSVMKDIHTYFATNKLLYDLFGFLELLMCHRCYTRKHKDNIFSKATYHSSGQFLTYLQQFPKVSHKDIRAWHRDIQHGLFEGLCNLFVNYVLVDKTLLSSHTMNTMYTRTDQVLDITKTIFNYLLCDYNLIPERQEIECNDCNDKAIVIFEQTLKPAMRHLFVKRNDYWIRHGIERRFYEFSTGKYPENNFFLNLKTDYSRGKNIGKGPDLWSVECDQGPFGECITQHPGALWSNYYGLITMNDYCNYIGNHPVKSPRRDHLAGQQTEDGMGIPFRFWVFCHPLEPTTHQFAISGIKNGAKILPSSVAIEFLNIMDRIIKTVTINLADFVNT
jgi:hypothetical protein